LGRVRDAYKIMNNLGIAFAVVGVLVYVYVAAKMSRPRKHRSEVQSGRERRPHESGSNE
jgi:hypothetical protein